MKTRILLILITVLSAIYFAIDYLIIFKIDFSTNAGVYIFLKQIMASIIFITLPAFVIGLLVALVPYQKRNYLKKLKPAFLVGLVLWLLSVLFFFKGYTVYYMVQNNVPLEHIKDFDSIKIPGGLDCESVKDGVFETDKMFIKRIGNKQIQKDKKNGEVQEFEVKWISSCEYLLIMGPIVTDVKIIAVHPTYYECWYNFKGYGVKVPVFTKVYRSNTAQ